MLFFNIIFGVGGGFGVLVNIFMMGVWVKFYINIDIVKVIKMLFGLNGKEVY